MPPFSPIGTLVHVGASRSGGERSSLRSETGGRGAIGDRLCRGIGAFILIHFLLICVIKAMQGANEEVLWVSYFSLALTGVGLLMRLDLLVGAAATLILLPHTIWLFDAAGGLLFGRFPLGITGYLAYADGWTWAATSHHFYLAPLLLAVVVCGRRYPRQSFVLAVLLSVVLTVVSRFLLPEASNINSAFRFLPRLGHDAIRWTDDLPAVVYLVLLNTLSVCVFFLPTALALRWVTRTRRM